MNKKIVGILLCMLVLFTIPAATASLSETDDVKEEQPTGPFSKTTVVGLITGARTNGLTTSFLALCVRYKTSSLIQEPETGMLVFQRVSFFGKLNGYLGQSFVMGSFHGSV